MSAQMKTYRCPQCRADLKRIVSTKDPKPYWLCIGPTEACGGIVSARDGAPLLLRGDPNPTCPCPDCGASMRLTQGGRYGDYWSYTAYPQCWGTIEAMPDGELPPPCPGDEEYGFMRIRSRKEGKGLGCRRYPDCTTLLERDGTPSKHNKKETHDD